MANGSNGESTLPMVTPQIVEELEMGLVPQAQAQPVAGLFGDQRIFVNAPQYHWHVQGAVVQMTRPGNTLLPWHRDYTILVTEQRKESWSCGTGWAMWQMLLGWNADWPLPKKRGNPSITNSLLNCPIL